MSLPKVPPMTADELFSKLEAKPSTPTDIHGEPIEELAGSLLKPLDVTDMMAVAEYVEKHGAGSAYLIMLARGIRNLDGSQVCPDEDAVRFAGCVNAPIKRAIDKIRLSSGYGKDDDEQKKTSSTGAPS